jgi:hypothetical protein
MVLARLLDHGFRLNHPPNSGGRTTGSFVLPNAQSSLTLIGAVLN